MPRTFEVCSSPANERFVTSRKNYKNACKMRTSNLWKRVGGGGGQWIHRGWVFSEKFCRLIFKTGGHHWMNSSVSFPYHTLPRVVPLFFPVNSLRSRPTLQNNFVIHAARRLSAPAFSLFHSAHRNWWFNYLFAFRVSSCGDFRTIIRGVRWYEYLVSRYHRLRAKRMTNGLLHVRSRRYRE